MKKLNAKQKNIIGLILMALYVSFMITLMIIAYVQAITVNKPDNSWKFLPASGFVDHYEVWKITPLDDNFAHLMDIPPGVNSEGYVVFKYDSPKDESYQLRLKAVDAAGNKGIWSVISVNCDVDTSMSLGEIQFVE